MWRLEIENIGGIRSGTATIEPGLNVVQASNFQGKSSLVAAVRTVLGATGAYDRPPLTEGASTGWVRLATGEDTYEVTLERGPGGGVTQSGTPYLADERDQVCARLFACLGEENPIRRAVRSGEDLTAFLQAPLDVEDIDSRIETLRAERAELDEEIADAETDTERLPAVQEAVTQLEETLADLRSRRDALQDRAEQGELADATDELAEKQGTLEEYERHIETERAALERTREQLSEAEAELAAVDVPEGTDDGENLTETAERIDALERKIGLVERLSQVTEEILEDGELDLLTDVERSLTGDEVQCWTCGASTEAGRIEERVAELHQRLESLRGRKSELEAEVAALEARQQEADRKRRERKRLQETVQRLELSVEEKREELEQLEARRTALEAAVDELESDLERRDAEYNEELADVKARITDTERRLAEKREELAALEASQEELAALRDRRETIEAEIEALRSRKRDTQLTLAEQFDEAMGAVVDRFAPGFGGAHLEMRTDRSGEIAAIDLVVAREGRETTVDALSEGEVELVGIVVALAGHRAFDVGERVPVVLLDGVGPFAADHLHSLTAYLRETGAYLVTTAYPEAGRFDGRTISPGEWDVVSDGESAPTG